LELVKAEIIKYIRVFYRTLLKKSVIGVFLLISTVYFSIAQTKQTSEQEVKAAFIYNFTRFIDWPPAAFSSLNSPFVIGVLGNDPVSGYLESLVQDEKLDNHLITVQRFTDLKQINQCNILFISAEEGSKISQLIPSINRRGILTVSDSPSFSKWGGIVRFFKDQNKLRLEINPVEGKAAQLMISSKLLSVSSIYKAK
jgi:hypothetical protein